MDNKLKLIDFSKGIKSAEVMYNDTVLQEQINRERLSIAGTGINSGFDMKLDNFTLTITDGTLVDNTGSEEYIDGKIIEIEKPKLILQTEKVYSDNNGRIVLSDVPYADNRMQPEEYNVGIRNITIYYADTLEEINISQIDNKVLYTNANDVTRDIIVTYNKTYDRIDTIYIDNSNNIKIDTGITSTTPSTYLPNDCKYILGLVKVESMHYDLDEYKAKATLIIKYTNRRMVYTDSDNNLFLCGIPFESLLKIYLEEPKNPKENMIWYNYKTNKLNIWRRTDNYNYINTYTFTSSDPDNEQRFKTGMSYTKEQLSVYKKDFKSNNNDEDTWTKFKDEEIIYYSDLTESEKGIKDSFEFRIVPKLLKGDEIRYCIDRFDGSLYWVPINDTSYLSTFEYKIWCPNKDNTGFLNYLPGLNLEQMKPDRENHDMQTFLFNASEMNLWFTPYKNELSIMIDQIPLYRDQFVEITVKDALNDILVNEYAIKNYGYTQKQLEELNKEYKEIGIGFKLLNELDRPGFIEVNVNHRVNDSILKNKLQRSATFITEKSIIYNNSLKDEDGNVVIETDNPYLYGENQLEVFVNGIKINNNLIVEISEHNEIGEFCKSFIIKYNLITNDEIIYRISTNVYSYDHIYKAIEEENKNLYAKIRSLQDDIETIKTYLNMTEE